MELEALGLVCERYTTTNTPGSDPSPWADVAVAIRMPSRRNDLGAAGDGTRDVDE